jgi:hypothetical protein
VPWGNEPAISEFGIEFALKAGMDTDKRRFPRVDARVQAQVATGGAAFDTEILDLSHGGARLAEVDGLSRGDEVRMFVSLPIPFRHRRRFCLFPAKVKWVGGGAMGLEFDEFDLQTFAQLELGLEVFEELR